MGFSRNIDYSSSRPVGPLFYNVLYESGKITTDVFASYYADVDDQSFFTLGGYDTVGTYYEGDLKWIDVDDEFFWQGDVYGVKVGDDVLTRTKPWKLIFDTGTSLAYIPYGVFYW